jgi:hypothetical protein
MGNYVNSWKNFFNFYRMQVKYFDELISLVVDHLSKEENRIVDGIVSEEVLIIMLG